MSGTFSGWGSRRCSSSSPPPRASPRSLYHLSPLFGVLFGSSGRWSVTHAHLRISTTCQHSHSIGKIFGKLSVAFVRQRSSPWFSSYSYLVHTVFTAQTLFLSLSPSLSLSLRGSPSHFSEFFLCLTKKKSTVGSRSRPDAHTHTAQNRPLAQLWPGNEVRGIVSENQLRCVCFSFELSFFFCFGMSFSDHCGVPHCSKWGRASPLLFSHSFPRSSEHRKSWFFAIRQADWSNFRVPNSTAWCIEHLLTKKKFAFMLVAVSKACGLFRDPLPVVWNRGRLDTFRKHVPCYQCFLFARRCLPSERTKHVDAFRESTMFAPAVIFGTNDEVTYYRKLAESEGKRFQRRRSLCQEAFCFFRLHLEEHWDCTRSVDARWQLRDTWRSRSSAFLNGNRLYPLFLFKYSFRRAIIQLDFQESKPKPEESHSEQSQRHRTEVYAAYVLWEVTMNAHVPFNEKLGFLAIQLRPIFLLKAGPPLIWVFGHFRLFCTMVWKT